MARPTTLLCPLCRSTFLVYVPGLSYQCRQGHYFTEIGLQRTLEQKLYQTLRNMIQQVENQEDRLKPLAKEGFFLPSSRLSIVPTLHHMLDILEHTWDGLNEIEEK